MTIYTAITGNYDLLKEQPKPPQSGLNYEAFLDREIVSPTWKVKPATSQFPHPCLNAKYHKILSHISFPDSEITLWIDGCIQIPNITPILDLAKCYLADSDLAVFAHSERYCLYQEAAFCIQRRKDDPKAILRQVFHYTQKGYPANDGLAECTILLRRHTKQVRGFNELWWNEILTGSFRDQISFPYVVRQTGIKVNYIPGNVRDGSLFLRRKHLLKYRRI